MNIKLSSVFLFLVALIFCSSCATPPEPVSPQNGLEFHGLDSARTDQTAEYQPAVLDTSQAAPTRIAPKP